MGQSKCPDCGCFLKNVFATFEGSPDEMEIKKVEGICKKHGKIDLTNSGDWDYEDFFPESQQG